jgi:site-specific DNA-methyltransferase (adenine-specific)
MEIRTREQYISYIRRTSTIPTGQDGSTPIKVIEEMVNKLPIDWSNPNLKILDPGFGFGGYLFFVYLKLIQYHSEEHILNNMLYGIEIEDFRFELVNHKLKIKNLIKGDFLDNKIFKNMNFDVILGNPPYQETSKTGGVQPKAHNLWSKFIVESLNNNLSTGGVVSFVTPTSWGSPSNDVFKLFKKNNLVLINTEISNHFDVGSTFSYWIVKNEAYIGNTNINGVNFDLNNFDYIQSDINSISTKIHKIFNESPFPKFNWDGDTTTNHSSKKENQWSDKYSTTHPYKVYHTNAQSYYSKIKSKSHDDFKVYLTISGYYNPLFDNGTISTSEVVPYIIVKSKKEGENLLNILNSKLYKYIVSSAKWSGFINKDILRILPNIGTNKEWSDGEIYNKFGIKSIEDINYIENYVG